MKLIATAIAAAAFALPAAAAAQEAPAMQDAPAPATDVSDEELSQFVGVIIQGQGIRNNAEMSEDQKRAAMLAAIEASELELARFTAIAQALGSDAALQARVEQEVINQLGAG